MFVTVIIYAFVGGHTNKNGLPNMRKGQSADPDKVYKSNKAKKRNPRITHHEASGCLEIAHLRVVFYQIGSVASLTII